MRVILVAICENLMYSLGCLARFALYLLACFLAAHTQRSTRERPDNTQRFIGSYLEFVRELLLLLLRIAGVGVGVGWNWWGLFGVCWELLGIARRCWKLLANDGSLLGVDKNCLKLLGVCWESAGNCWELPTRNC